MHFIRNITVPLSPHQCTFQATHPLLSCSHIQQHNSVSKLLRESSFSLCHNNYQTTKCPNIISATVYTGCRLANEHTGTGSLFSVTYCEKILSW